MSCSIANNMALEEQNNVIIYGGVVVVLGGLFAGLVCLTVFLPPHT